MTIYAPEQMPVDLGMRIRNERRGRRWSQARLAAKAGVGRETIYRLEAGRTPIADTVLRVEAAFALESPYFVPAWSIADRPDAAGFGSRTRSRRRKLGLTLRGCAAAAGVSATTLSRFERGAERSPKLTDMRNGVLPVAMRNDGLAVVLGFADSVEMTGYCLA